MKKICLDNKNIYKFNKFLYYFPNQGSLALWAILMAASDVFYLTQMTADVSQQTQMTAMDPDLIG